MDGEPEPLINYQELVNEWLETGNHFEAIKVGAKRMVELDPTIAASFNLRGYLHWTPETIDQSMSDYQTAINLDPGFEPAWHNLANNLGYLKKFNELLEFANNFVNKFPENAMAYEQRARALYWLNQRDQALVDSNRAIELNPESSIAWALRAEINRELGRLDAAQADIQKSIKLDPESEYLKEIEKTIPRN
jgi:tetratricopeptide (TPR) repeat protein